MANDRVPETKTILIAGVGGQGTILAGKVISDALVSCGFDVKMSEIHGMAQRGGSVTTQIRFGSRVYSPVSEAADYLLAFEAMEALRWIRHLPPGGMAVVNDCEIPSAPVLRGLSRYPSQSPAELNPDVTVVSVCATEIARRLGNPRVANAVMLGVLSTIEPFDTCRWLDALSANIRPQFLEINRIAFDHGSRTHPVLARQER